MKKTKMEKGITLIALIITIVVLLILAAVAINNIQNDGILKYAQNAASDYNKAIKDEQSVLDGYLSYLKGDNWIPIYEGTAETENGSLVLNNRKHLFTAGNKYRITVESDEYTGTVETTAVFFTSITNNPYFLLFGVHEGKAITANSLAEYEELGSSVTGSYTAVMGMNITENSEKLSGIAMDGNTCEYKITKIEEKVENVYDAELFEGELSLSANNQVVYNLNIDTSPARIYEVNVTINGDALVVYTEPYCMNGIICSMAVLNEYSGASLLFTGYYSEAEGCLFLATEDCVINSIKPVRYSTTCKEENGFIAFYHGNNNDWGLYKTPNTSYIVPEEVCGKAIEVIFIDLISGEPTFTKYYDITYYDMPIPREKANVVITDNEVLSKMGSGLGYYFKILDLTGCGDNIEIPKEILSSSTCETVYVTSAVKAKYPDNAKVVPLDN